MSEGDVMLTQEEITGKMITVNGVVDPLSIGVTMAHEHILLWYGPPPGGETAPPPPPPPFLDLSGIELQANRLNDYVNAGGSALISMSSYGLRWDAPTAPVLPFAPLTFVQAI